MLVPALPPHLLMSGFKGWQVGLVMGVLGLGIYMFGPFCSYLLQRYRRNRVCISSMIGMVVCMAGLYYADLLPTDRGRFEVLVALRFLLGACFGLAQMSLYSTLIIDSCESFLRTEANHSSVWFSRFALSLGPVGALLVSRLLGYRAVLVFAGCLSVVSFLLIGMVRFPFKAPDGQSLSFIFHQIGPSLPAWDESKHIFPFVGDRYEPWTLCRLHTCRPTCRYAGLDLGGVKSDCL